MFVLILFIGLAATPPVLHDFTSKERCDAAREFFLAQGARPSNVVCVPK